MNHDTDNDVLDEDDETIVEPRVERFDQYLDAKMGPLMDVVSKVIGIVENTETRHKPRDRKRKPQDQRAFLASIAAVVSNLAHVVLQWPNGCPLIVSRSTTAQGIYDNRNLPGRTFVSVLDLLVLAGLITEDRGYWKGDGNRKSTTIEATPALRGMIQSHGVDFTCFRQCSNQPLLILKRSTKKHPGAKAKKDVVSYTRNTTTEAMVDQVERLNAFLSDATIDFIDDEDSDHRVDTINRRTLVRYFTIRSGQGVRFDQGGRLFGKCFWSALKSTQRDRIRIDGEPVADLDFQNLGPRLVYARMGTEAPAGDLYDLTGHLEGYHHDNPEHRKAIKRALASCLNGGAGGKRGTPPKDGRSGTKGILDGLPKGISAAKIRKALTAKHPAFSGILEACSATQDREKVPVGFSIMFDESRILLRALEKLKDRGVVALPFHDGLMVARSNQRIAQEALQEASLEIVRVRLPVTIKADYGAPGASVRLLAS